MPYLRGKQCNKSDKRASKDDEIRDLRYQIDLYKLTLASTQKALSESKELNQQLLDRLIGE